MYLTCLMVKELQDLFIKKKNEMIIILALSIHIRVE